MRSRARTALGFASVLFAAANFAACGSSSNDSMVVGGTAASAGAGGTATNTGSGGSLVVSNGGSNSGVTTIGAGGDGNACAAHVSTAQLVPLDMYIMLDISSSMLEPVSGQTTKWDAVKSALETFLNDSASAGLGVGLQYFPQIKPNAPTSCTTDASCGDSGPCFTQFCKGYADDGLGIFPCSSNTDCPTLTDGINLYRGTPCTALTECTVNTDVACPNLGSGCGNDPNGADLGMCQLKTSFVCEHTTNCDTAVYAAPARAIAALPSAAAALIQSIDGTTPNGETPTGPALTGAIQQASTWAKAHPDHRVVAVMATDGLPTECTPTDIDQVGAIATAGVQANPSIDTFVIGVFGADDIAANAPDNLDTIAKDGGTTSAFIVDTTKDVTAQFLAALDAIRGGKLDCAFQIPQPDNGGTLDYSQVNVQVSITGQPDTVLYYVGSADKCDPTSGGWYYDVDPAVNVPTKIITCQTSCNAFQAAKDASVQIALGCQTVVK
ncbi:MAG TPA: vWA domain-containing protein [Polyangiaceae bacterium]|jgi:hypothetical protein|nr:vWA domain-containing protein [Polyangiaceae bacterium]